MDVRRFFPGLQLLGSYDRVWLRGDVFAGVAMWGALAPQSMGFATMAQLPPVVGLYASMGAMATYWLWGSSRCLNVGADAAVSLLVATSLVRIAEPSSDDYPALAVLLSLMTALVLLVGGLLRLGRVADFFSRPILAGYVFGSGLLVISSQLQAILGITVDTDAVQPSIFDLLANLDTAQVTSIAMAVGTALVFLGFRRFVPQIPGSPVAMALSILIVYFGKVDVAVVGSFERGVPLPSAPSDVIGSIPQLIGPAFAIAMLVYPDSVLTARSLTDDTDDEINPNQEYFALAGAHLGAAMASGMPVNASGSRSFVLTDAGAKSQVANLVAAGMVLFTVLFLAPVFDYLPTAALSTVVLIAGVRLLRFPEIERLRKFARTEFTMAVLTVVSVLVLGMLQGVIAAVALSMFAVVLQAARPQATELGQVPGTRTFRALDTYKAAVTFPGIYACRFGADIFFANSGAFQRMVLQALDEEHQAKAVIVDMEAVSSFDSTAAQMLVRTFDVLDRHGVGLVLARAHSHVIDQFNTTGLDDRLAWDKTYFEVNDAVTDLHHRLGLERDHSIAHQVAPEPPV